MRIPNTTHLQPILYVLIWTVNKYCTMCLVYFNIIAHQKKVCTNSKSYGGRKQNMDKKAYF